MTSKTDISVAYLARGHWSYEASNIEKYKTYKSAEYQMEEVNDVESTSFDLWFIFTNSSMPKETSKLSWEDKMNLPAYIGSHDPEVKKAFNDLGKQNQWRDNITTSLGIHEDLHEYISYKVHSREEKQSKIGFWRGLKASTNKNGFTIDNYLKPGAKEYDYFAKKYRVSGKKPMFLLSKDKKYLNLYKAFVVDEILEVRKSELSKDGNYSLYDITKAQKKLIRKGNVEHDEENENENNVEKQLKKIEKAIVNSGEASRLHRISSSNSPSYSSANNYVRSSSSSSGSGGAWAILIIIIIIIMFIIFSTR